MIVLYKITNYDASVMTVMLMTDCNDIFGLEFWEIVLTAPHRFVFGVLYYFSFHLRYPVLRLALY